MTTTEGTIAGSPSAYAVSTRPRRRGSPTTQGVGYFPGQSRRPSPRQQGKVLTAGMHGEMVLSQEDQEFIRSKANETLSP